MLKVTKLFTGRAGTKAGLFVPYQYLEKSLDELLLHNATELMRYLGRKNLPHPPPHEGIFFVTDD